MTMIHIKDWISFAPNMGVMVKEGAVTADPEELHEAITAALSHMSDRDLLNACCGDQGPLRNFDDLWYEDYIEMKSTFDAVREANRICGDPGPQ